MKRLSDKVIVVAGGGGIGNEMARRYADEGASVVIGDRDEATARAVAEEIGSRGGSAIAVQFDGTDEASARALMASARDAFGGMDGININFASFADAALDVGVEVPLAIYDEMMRVNARGFLICTQAALPLLLARGGGSIVYTSSDAAYMCEPVRIGYAMTKAAVNALMRGVAKRHGPDNIRANAIVPGIIAHAKFDTEIDPTTLNNWAFGIQAIQNRLGAPSDIAAMSALLMSDEGSFITGQSICVDGGAIMRA